MYVNNFPFTVVAVLPLRQRTVAETKKLSMPFFYQILCLFTSGLARPVRQRLSAPLHSGLLQEALGDGHDTQGEAGRTRATRTSAKLQMNI